MRLSRPTLFLLLLLFAFQAPLFAGVKAKGSAEIFNNNEGAARDQARLNALRDAVEQGVGTLVDSNTKVENWQVIKDEIYTSARGFVTKFDVLKDQREGSAWVVEIDAEVATDALKAKLQDLRILHKKMGNKRLMVIYRPEDPKAMEPDHPAVAAALGNLQTALNQAGFRVFDQKSVERNAAEKRPSEAKGKEAWIKIASEQQADILAEFELSDNLGSYGAAQIQSARVSLRVRIYDVSSGLMISNQSTEQKQLTNARPGSFDWRNALAQAAQKAADQTSAAGINDIVEHYKNIGDLGNAFLIRFTGFSEDEEDTLINVLENLDSYQSLSELKNDTAMVEVEYFSGLKGDQLHRKLRLKAKEKGIALKSQEIIGNKMEFVKQY
ncbi:MAG: hypothetical protein A2600_04595 [Candidatus Lambdaproteobacteria bacterium RIFOXYD1_FULL_56_27]|uniref:Flagellar assembly protein T N-terminal domain-containing protein n=1 Tax=Candidatus Lambdaproteobacteria bacterium RIFOXYD2_FULL_56_26 TaxID=1817773 RepID=A0A1F6H3U4_9PROT|nr:MAG: hypothetical protein A2426_13660 [Candidatus Lambdaproteobacteria bacterium RIFOXYC1_FULL_56_13]OGH05033.1 MAG: hypothetical protein A2557_08660 [Candidatus Lambdaproteobacteria bacterium RIFOXYD2_FULL_56_26]OGH09498.1 MAG: hypothetical protein A2600_04595 [Candidatus Lambdaproteobacteria bacterium RIFOXYD1_FULL_56_27]